MVSELNIEVTDRELAYRSKNFSDLKAFEKRELFCSSCGNILSHDSRHVYSHPIFGILQCENCKNHFKTVTFSLDKDDSVRYCHICGRQRSSSYGCSKRNCPYEFCKTCIKRNIPQSLLDAESGEWQCFACNPKPLWKLRGACAAVMSSLPKRTKAKKVKSRDRSSDREDASSDLKNVSYVRRTQLQRNKKLNKRLQSLCDTESPIPQDEDRPHSVPARGNNHANGKAKGSGAKIVCDETSSDDTDIVEIVPLKPKKIVTTKSQRDSSSEKTKVRARMRSSDAPKKRARGSLIADDTASHTLGSSSDTDSEPEEPKKMAKTRTNCVIKKSNTTKVLSETSEDEAETVKKTKRNGAAKAKKSSAAKTFKIVNARPNARGAVYCGIRPTTAADSSDSSSDDSVTASMKRLMPTAFAKKSTTNVNKSNPSKKENSADEKTLPVSKKSVTSTPITKPSTIKSSVLPNPSAKSTKRQSKRLDLHEADASTSQKPKKPSVPIKDVSVILNDIAKIVKKNSRRTFDHLQSQALKPGSDSSSGKEFLSEKLSRKSCMSLRRIQDLEEDYTMSPPNSATNETSGEISKEHSFALKKTVRDFFAELRATATQLLNDIEHAQKAYCGKDEAMRATIRPVDASSMIRETKKVVSTLKSCVEKHETKMTDYYDGWCKKTKQKNVWKASSDVEEEQPLNTQQERPKKARKLAEDGSVSDSDTSADTKIASPEAEKRPAVKQRSTVVAPGERVDAVVSDCDSDEIFSGDETRTSARGSKAASPEKSVADKSADSTISKKDEESRKRPLTTDSEDETPVLSPSDAALPGKSVDQKSANSKDSKTDKKSRKLEFVDSSDETEVEANEDAESRAKAKKLPEAPKTGARAGSPTLSQFSGHSDLEDDRPTQKTEELLGKSAKSPVASRDEDRNSINQSPDLFETSFESEVDESSKSKYKKALNAGKRRRAMNRKSIEAKSKPTVSDSDSTDCEDSKKIEKESEATSSPAMREDSKLSPKKETENIATEESEEKNKEGGLSDANTEEYVNPEDMNENLKAVTSDAEGPEVPTESPPHPVKEPNDSDAATELYCSSSGKQSNAPVESPPNPGKEPSDSDAEGPEVPTPSPPNPGKEPSDSDAEGPEVPTKSPPNPGKEPDDSDAATELYCSSSGKQSDAPEESPPHPGKVPNDSDAATELDCNSSGKHSDAPAVSPPRPGKEPNDSDAATELDCSSSGKHSDVPAESPLNPGDESCDSDAATELPIDDVVAEEAKQSEKVELATDGTGKEKSKKKDKSSTEFGNKVANRSDSIEKISSLETVIADDLPEKPAKKSKSRKLLAEGADLSDEENRRARERMLMSSNSEDSSDGELAASKTMSSSNKESNGSPLTPPDSDTKSDKISENSGGKSTEQNSEREDNPSGSEESRRKRSKFRLKKNRFWVADEQLKRKCEVRVARLENNVLRRYSRALKKSRKYVEAKEIERLTALHGLDKDKGKAADSSSNDDEKEDSAQNLNGNKKKSRAKQREETLMDHLKKVETGESILISSDSESESAASGTKNKPKDNGDDMFAEANRLAKKRMLDDSSESGGADEAADQNTDEDEAVKKTKKVVKKEKKNNSSEDEETKNEKAEKAEKARWRKNKTLTFKISDSDSDEGREKFNLSQEKKAEKKKSQGSDSEVDTSPKKKRVRRRVLHSDSDVGVSPASNSDSDSSVQSSKKKKKKKKNDDSSADEKEMKKKSRKRTRRGGSSDSSLEEIRPKTTRRKRIKAAAGSESDSDEDLDNSQGTPGKAGRKNIRKVLRDKQVAEDTKQAAKDEEERLKRIADRQKLYNEMYEVRLAGEEKVEKLVLDFDEVTKEPLVSVDEGLVKRLKPHQAQGIKFMWDACFESLERTKSTRGSGCILAHCMGLGKSFQIVTLAHTLLMHRETGINTILVVCPLSTVLNWVNEFKIWLSDLPTGDDVEIYEMTKMKKNNERKYQLERWRETGGVMIIGYEMYRNLSNGSKKVRKNIQESFMKTLVDPGPDLIVCDEGHLLKNEDSALSKAMRRIKTLRRIVLTGTPLQNNLIEYHCMVQFVKPNLLGTKREFMNRFENPITNGQFDDSTEYDVKLMKKRAHVLHKMLEGSVQRFDYSVLTPFLPPKQEYVIFVKLTEVQIKMYQHYLENYARSHRGVGGSLFADFQALQRIWTHPMVMQMNAEKVERANEKKRLDATDSEGSLRDFIDDGSDTPASSDSDVRSASGSDDEKKKRGTRGNPLPEERVPTPPATEEANHDETSWWTQYIANDEVYEDLRVSSKLLILFRILKESEQIGDKVLVFSQSLYSLTLIERFLGMIDDETQKGNHPKTLDGHSGSWALGLDYFRLDGQSSTDNRRMWCNTFNKPSNTRARLFLISTRAGGLGINLTAANRVIIFDASWNPSHDVQSIFRIYRFGQKKPCYVYRLLAAGTMEEKIYNRQVTKLSLSCRVVDEQQIERHYSNNALAELYKLELPSEAETTLNLPKDRLLAEIFLKYKHAVETYHEHDSLLENQAGEELDEDERQQAWLEYEEEKKGKRPVSIPNYQEQFLMQQYNMMNFAQQQNVLNPAMMADMANIQRMMEKDFPGLLPAQQKMMATKAVYDMYNYVEKQAMASQNAGQMNRNNMNPAIGGAQFGYDNSNHMQGVPSALGQPSIDTLRLYQQSLAQAQNGQIGNNYINNQQGQLREALGLPRQLTIKPVGPISGPSANLAAADDDVMEVPLSPDRNPVSSTSVPGGSRKSKEE